MARRVLIADDSPTIQKKAGGILTGEGYEVVTVSNGVAAVKKLPTVMPLVVLADVAMPGKDGYEVCEFVKKDGALKHVSVLLVFSDTDPIEEDKAAQAQADGRISKPFFNPEELISVVGKFAAMAEAAAPELVAPPPAPPVYVTEPVDAEPEPEHKQAIPDISTFFGGIAIGDMGAEELFAPAPPPFEPIVEPAPEMPQPEIAAPEPPSAPPESPPISAEPVLVEEAAPMPPLPPAEEEPPATETTMLFHAPSEIAEPMLIEEATGASAPLELTAPSDEPEIPAMPATTLESSSLLDAESGQERFAAAEESPAAGESVAPPAKPEIPAMPTTTLESFSLQDSESGQVRLGAAEESPAASESVAPPPAAPKTLDAEQVFAIVHKVVVNMSPPALSPQIVEEIARRFAEEITAELNSEPTAPE